MSSSINSIGSGNSTMMQMQNMKAMKRPDPAEMAANLFAQLDTAGQGYLQKSDLQSAFDKISTTDSSSASSSTASTSTSSNVDALFSQLDSDSDGKVTKQEFSDTLKKLAEQLDNQFMNMRKQDGIQNAGGMPPPPPPGGGGNDAGFTKDELTSQLQEIGASDSKRSSLISSIVNNFDKADSDGNGKVSMQEAIAFDQTLQNASTRDTAMSSSTATATTSSALTSASNDLSSELLRQIMQLMQAYNVSDQTPTTSSISVSA